MNQGLNLLEGSFRKMKKILIQFRNEKQSKYFKR